MSLLTTSMFFTTSIYCFILMKFFPGWHWLPQSIEEAIAEGIAVMLMFLCIVMQKLDSMTKT